MVEEKDFLKRIERLSKQQPDKILIDVQNEQLSYSEFIRDIEAISRRLQYLGIQEDDKVGMILPNCVAWYKFFWAIVKLGAQPVPLDPQSGEWELKRLIELIEMKLCITVSKYRSNSIINSMKHIKGEYEQLQKVIVLDGENDLQEGFLSMEAFKVLPEATGKIAYIPDEAHIMSFACTSGSTGNPKILEVPYKGFYQALWDMSQYLGLTNEDVMLVGMPLYHQGGFGMGLQNILQGGTVIYEPQFNPELFLNVMEQKKATVIQLTTTLAKILISMPDFWERDFSSVKIAYFAGEVLTEEIASCFYEKLDIRTVNIIGSSETATMVVWDSKVDLGIGCNSFRALSFTKAKALNKEGVEVNEGEVGELVIYTDGLIKGYYKNELENKNHFCNLEGKRWFKTGDLVAKEKGNRICFVGRCKRIIKRGANLVYAEEVEAFLMTHPDIEAVAVVKREDEIMGEAIVAYIQTKEQKPLTRGEILRFGKNKLSAYKIPDEVIVVDEVPHDIGKIQFKYIHK